jgi:hypothetical protein
MVQAIRDLADSEGEAVRDSDVKRRMLAIQENFDESELGYSKFSLFLKQADEHEVIELNRGDNGIYEVRVRKGAEALTPAPSETPAPTKTTEQDARPARKAEAAASATRDASDGSDGVDGRRLRPRLSARRRGASGEPPPLLEGQAFTTSGAVDAGAVGAGASGEPGDSAAAKEAVEPQKTPRRGGRERGEKGRSAKPRSDKAATSPAATSPAAKRTLLARAARARVEPARASRQRLRVLPRATFPSLACPPTRRASPST